MKKRLLARYPNWYLYVLLAAYSLPVPACFIYTFIVLIGTGFTTFIAAFIGTFLFGFILFFPLICVYYAFLTFAHTMIDQMCFPVANSRKRVISVSLAFACSVFLTFSSVWTLQSMLHTDGWIPFVFMLLGIGAVYAVLVIRVVHEAAFLEKNATKE